MKVNWISFSYSVIVENSRSYSMSSVPLKGDSDIFTASIAPGMLVTSALKLRRISQREVVGVMRKISSVAGGYPCKPCEQFWGK